MNMKPDISILKQYTELGIGLAGVNDYGAYIDKGKDRFTTDFQQIEGMIAGKKTGYPIKRFRFMPSDGGFICFDIDIKNGVNGKEILQAIAEKNGLDLKASFNKTTFVKTPSGYHFYFKSLYKGKLKKELCRGVEIKTGKLNLTAAGSVKDGKIYSLKGLLKNALELPAALLDMAKMQTQAPQRKPIAGKKGKAYTIDFFIAETIDQESGNHNRQVKFSSKCKRFGYSLEQTLQAIYANPDIFGTGKDTETTVKSIFNQATPSEGKL